MSKYIAFIFIAVIVFELGFLVGDMHRGAQQDRYEAISGCVDRMKWTFDMCKSFIDNGGNE